MSNREEIRRLLGELHAARVAGRLEDLCALFADNAYFRISGASDGKPVDVTARGSAEIRTWLAVMVKSFRVTNYVSLATVIDGSQGVVHWQADIHSRITGAVTATHLVDLVEITEARISSYIEYFVPG